MQDPKHSDQDRPTDPPDPPAPRVSREQPTRPRYERVRLLGSGAMGTVHLVRDRETGEQLALKRLFGVDAKAVLRIKREFRSLADLSHPNLVKMYDFGRDEEGWFLTMELVDGESLDTHLAPSALSTVSVDSALSELSDFESRLRERILPAFAQLSVAIRALHRASMLHRDLKPSNVLVSRGRVVVLDFGLVRGLGEQADVMTIEGGITGTPAYMAPEQARAAPLSEATDWYAFGTMLYEALTGVLPFDGNTFELLQHKLERDPEPARKHNPDVPEALDTLCMSLLCRDPARRPSGGAVLGFLKPYLGQRLDLPHTPSRRPVAGPASDRRFIGRDDERQRLWAAMDRVTRREPAVVHLHGPSGSGKSALSERFVGEVENKLGATALVLRSRCYEREAMPFKALDGVIDALCRHLSAQHDYEVSNLLPMDVAVLAQLFPVLGRLRPVQHLLASSSSDGATRRGRKRAEAALRELLERLASRGPLVIWIDDLQWGDLDSAAILAEWLRGRLPAGVLLMLSYRSDEIATSHCLRALLRGDGQLRSVPSWTIEVGPLALADLQTLCALQLGDVAAANAKLVARLAQESDGSPFLATQLATLASAKLRRGDRDLDRLSITDLVSQAMGMLSEDQQRLLQVLSVAGRPLAPRVALRAAGIEHGGREALLALGRLHLARSRDQDGERRVELYHDRVREGVYALLEPRLRERVHADLLSTLEFVGHGDSDWLHALSLGAGETVAALRYGLDAAARASATLAFERAAELYRRCVELSEPDASNLARLYGQLALAEGACGRGLKAADACLRAAELSVGDEAVSLLQGASSHLLRTGRFEEGERMLTRVLSAMGTRMPPTRARLMLALAWERSRLSLRGLQYTRRSEDEVPPATLLRIDTFNAIRNETLSSNPLRAALFLAWQLRLALDAGEPMRVLQALTGLAYMRATRGPSFAKQTDALLVQIESLAEEIGTPEARSQRCATAAIVNWMLGRPDRVPVLADECAQLYRSHASPKLEVSYYVRLAVTAAHSGALYELSDYSGFAAVLLPALQEAREADNRSALLYLSLPETLYDELCGRSIEAQARIEEQRTQLPLGSFGIYHALHLASVGVAACLSGDHAWGLRYLEEQWPAYQRSLVRRSAMLSFVVEAFRLRLLVNDCLSGGANPEQLKRLLKRDIPALAKHPLEHRAVAIARILQGRVLFALGERDKAIALLQQDSQLTFYQGERARARHALGKMIGGEQGAGICDEALRALRELGVVEPLPFVRCFHPELMDDDLPPPDAESPTSAREPFSTGSNTGG